MESPRRDRGESAVCCGAKKLSHSALKCFVLLQFLTHVPFLSSHSFSLLLLFHQEETQDWDSRPQRPWSKLDTSLSSVRDLETGQEGNLWGSKISPLFSYTPFFNSCFFNAFLLFSHAHAHAHFCGYRLFLNRMQNCQQGSRGHCQDRGTDRNYGPDDRPSLGPVLAGKRQGFHP